MKFETNLENKYWHCDSVSKLSVNCYLIQKVEVLGFEVSKEANELLVKRTTKKGKGKAL